MTSITYKDAGVDIDKGNAFVNQIKKIAKKTKRRGVIGEIGGFGGLFSLDISSMKNPVLVSSTDGVGTKLKIAFMTGKHDTVGIDLVAMCVDDVAVQGASPLFFLDYLAMGILDLQVATDVIKGIADGCQQAGCALIGGETAELPDFYKKNEYDLAGFTVGVVNNDQIIDGSEIRVGDKIIGIASSGLHSNGYSLARKICFDAMKLKVEKHIDDFGRTLGEELLEPTKIYSEMIKQLTKLFPVHGMAHITGGGLPDNVGRILPQTCAAEIEWGSWEVPPVFPFLQKGGKVTDDEMQRTFNNGIGMVLVTSKDRFQEVLQSIKAMGEKAFLIGEVKARQKNGPQVHIR
jgi:phosphoribosylformylglycinamidine cyclo-ligase